MKLKHIIIGLLIIILPINSSIFLEAYYSLNNEEFRIFINTQSLGIISTISFFITCFVVIIIIAYLLIENWDKKITLNSIIKSIKSIKLN